MDDVTLRRTLNKLDRRVHHLEATIGETEARLAASVELTIGQAEGRLGGRVDNVARGFSVALDAAGAAVRQHIDDRFDQLAALIKDLAVDRKIAELELRIASLEARLDQPKG